MAAASVRDRCLAVVAARPESALAVGATSRIPPRKVGVEAGSHRDRTQAVLIRVEAPSWSTPSTRFERSRRSSWTIPITSSASASGWLERTAGRGTYAARVVREYQRFVALAVTTPELLTPSNQVDQAWHLHLQDTVGYRRFCAEVLGRRLEHRPSRGGLEERAQFTAAYEATLCAYPGMFGDSPPADIWPEAEKRFGVEGHQRRRIPTKTG